MDIVDHETYEAYDEPLGTEGKARIKLLKKVFRKGWIRGRYDGGRNKLFMETDNAEKRQKDLQECIDYFAIKHGSYFIDYSVNISASY